MAPAVRWASGVMAALVAVAGVLSYRWRLDPGAAALEGGGGWSSGFPRRHGVVLSLSKADLHRRSRGFAADWFRSKTVMSMRDGSRRLPRFGEVEWESSSQALVVAHSDSGRCARAPMVALLLRLVAGSRRLDLGL